MAVILPGLVCPEEITFVVTNTCERVAYEYNMSKRVWILLRSITMHRWPFKEN